MSWSRGVLTRSSIVGVSHTGLYRPLYLRGSYLARMKPWSSISHRNYSAPNPEEASSKVDPTPPPPPPPKKRGLFRFVLLSALFSGIGYSMAYPEETSALQAQLTSMIASLTDGSENPSRGKILPSSAKEEESNKEEDYDSPENRRRRRELERRKQQQSSQNNSSSLYSQSSTSSKSTSVVSAPPRRRQVPPPAADAAAATASETVSQSTRTKNASTIPQASRLQAKKRTNVSSDNESGTVVLDGSVSQQSLERFESILEQKSALNTNNTSSVGVNGSGSSSLSSKKKVNVSTQQQSKSKKKAISMSEASSKSQSQKKKKQQSMKNEVKKQSPTKIAPAMVSAAEYEKLKNENEEMRRFMDEAVKKLSEGEKAYDEVRRIYEEMQEEMKEAMESEVQHMEMERSKRMTKLEGYAKEIKILTHMVKWHTERHQMFLKTATLVTVADRLADCLKTGRSADSELEWLSHAETLPRTFLSTVLITDWMNSKKELGFDVPSMSELRDRFSTLEGCLRECAMTPRESPTLFARFLARLFSKVLVSEQLPRSGIDSQSRISRAGFALSNDDLESAMRELSYLDGLC